MEKDSTKPVQSDNFDFAKFIKVCLKSWPIFAISIICCLALTVFYLMVHTPKFEVNAQLKLPVETMSGLKIDMAQSFSLGDMFGSSTTDNEISVIKSHNVFFNTARDLNLNVFYSEKKLFFKWNAVYTTSPIIVSSLPSLPDTLSSAVTFILDKLDNGNTNIEVKARKKTILKLDNQELPTLVQTPYGPFTIEKTPYYETTKAYKLKAVYMSYSAAAQTYINLVDVYAPNKKTDFIGLSFKTPDPTFGKKLLNSIIANYNQVGTLQKDQKNTETLDFVSNRLESLRTEIAVSEAAMEQFKKNNQITMVEQDAAFVLEKLGRLETALIQAETEAKILKETLDFVANPANKYSVIPNLPSTGTPIGDVRNDPGNTANILSNATRELNVYNHLVLERMKLVGTSAKSGNASVKLIDEQLDALHESIISSVTQAYETANVKYNEAKRQYDLVQNRIGALPSLEKEYIGLERTMLVQEQLYLFLLKQREEASMNIAKATHSIDIIDAPYILKDQLGLSPKIAIALAIFMGMLIGAAWVLLLNFPKAPTLSLSEIKNISQAPLLSPVKANNNSSALASQDPASTAAESMRGLRADVQFILTHCSGGTIAVESMADGEGKTYVAVNLALELAKSGRPTLLIDASLHNPDVAQMLGLSEGTGLSGALDSKSEPQLQTVAAGAYQLAVLTAGTASTTHPADLLGTERFTKLIEELRKEYDYIVLDTPAIESHSDAFAISDIPDLTLVVVRKGVTTPKQMAKINNLYRQGRLPRMVVVPNGIADNEA